MFSNTSFLRCFCLGVVLTLFTFFLVGCQQNPSLEEIDGVSSGTLFKYSQMESRFVVPRDVYVWLPENYSDEAEYSVLYMHDGQMLFDSLTTWNKQEWGVDETVTRLIAEEKINECIVVGMASTDHRHAEYFPQKPFESLRESYQDSLMNHFTRYGESPLFSKPVCSDNYLKFITEELKPFIDESYSTKTDSSHTYIMGSSMGGLISMYALFEYPEVFGGAACMSTHWIGAFDTTNNPIPKAFADYIWKNLSHLDSPKLYFDHGTETLDRFYEPHQQLVDSLIIHRMTIQSSFEIVQLRTLKFSGADHSERSWNKRLHIPLTFLLGGKSLND